MFVVPKLPKTQNYIYRIIMHFSWGILGKKKQQNSVSHTIHVLYIPRRPFVWEISRPSLFDIEICFPTLKQENVKIFKIRIIFLIRMLFLSHIVVWYVSYLGSSSLLGFGCAMGITSTSCAPHVVCFCARRRSQLYMIFSRYLAVILP